MQAFEQIMETDADYRAGLNLVVCCFAVGDKERMKQAFVRLANVRPGCPALLWCPAYPAEGWLPGIFAILLLGQAVSTCRPWSARQIGPAMRCALPAHAGVDMCHAAYVWCNCGICCLSIGEAATARSRPFSASAVSLAAVCFWMGCFAIAVPLATKST